MRRRELPLQLALNLLVLTLNILEDLRRACRVRRQLLQAHRLTLYRALELHRSLLQRHPELLRFERTLGRTVGERLPFLQKLLAPGVAQPELQLLLVLAPLAERLARHDVDGCGPQLERLARRVHIARRHVCAQRRFDLCDAQSL